MLAVGGRSMLSPLPVPHLLPLAGGLVGVGSGRAATSPRGGGGVGSAEGRGVRRGATREYYGCAWGVYKT